MKTAIVSGADSGYFDLLVGAVGSVQQSRTLVADVVVLDFGLTPQQRDTLRAMGADVREAHPPVKVRGLIDSLRVGDRALLLRTFLPDLLPDFEIVVWLDSDAWVQRQWALARYIDEAVRVDVVAGEERHPAYGFQPRLHLWEWKHLTRAFGVIRGTRLSLRNHINAGVFAAVTTSPLWKLWQDTLLNIFRRTGSIAPYDQMVLNYCIYDCGLTVSILNARFNWICDRRLPLWDTTHSALAVPGTTTPEPLGIVHLAGTSKAHEVDMLSTGGKRQRASLRFPAQSPH